MEFRIITERENKIKLKPVVKMDALSVNCPIKLSDNHIG